VRIGHEGPCQFVESIWTDREFGQEKWRTDKLLEVGGNEPPMASKMEALPQLHSWVERRVMKKCEFVSGRDADRDL
jgi:hypothetical protein